MLSTKRAGEHDDAHHRGFPAATAGQGSLGQQVEQLGTRALAQRVNEPTEENLQLSAAEGAMTAANKELRHQANELTDDLAGARTSVKRMIRNQSR